MGTPKATTRQSTAAPAPSPEPPATGANELSELGEKIFLDRYALKDASKESLALGDTVVVCTDVKTGQREIGTITEIQDGGVRVRLRDGTLQQRAIEHIDKPLETHPAEMMARVARGIASVEGDRAAEWEQKFRWLLDEWKFVPAGRILTAAGTGQALTYYNCYVIPSPRDARHGIVETLSNMMEIMSRGGGVGINLSSLRPRHAYVRGVNGRSSGSVSWGALYSFVTGLIEQGGSRRGALMLILNVWHPDVLDFIHSKREAGKITNANISVGITDDFMAAVEADREWELVFPDTSDPDYDTEWDGNLEAWRAKGKPVIVHKTRPAREIWNAIIESAWASAEPGVFFVDRYNHMSNSWYYAPITCTNPCGEQGLPAWGVCNLGAINLARFVADGEVQWGPLGQAIHYAVRFLDDVIDATPYFFEENERQQKSERRIGLNTMGLAEMLIRLGIRYGTADSEEFIDRLYEFIAREAYTASAELAVEKGVFPAFDAEKFLQSGYMQAMPESIRSLVREKGMRNVTLLTQAPNGTIGTMVGTSTGIEPFYSWTYFRKSRLGVHEENVAIVREWEERNPGEPLPDFFVAAMDLTPEEHVRVQAAVQRWVDSSISKTCNVPNSYTIEQTRRLYELMYRLGCKGGTIYRDGSRDEQVLLRKEKEPENAPATVSAPAPDVPKVRPRPYKRAGVTVSKKTPAGTAHITMNNDDDGRPFEVFVDIGKGGTDVKAMAEAIGRLMSLVLRIASPLSPLDRIREMINQLKGIGGARWVGFGRDRVRSLPDAVAQALEEHYGVEGNGNGHIVPDELSDPIADNTASIAADLCPACGQAAFVHAEGCMTCHACGHSEC
ncbi:MAG TPA: adenosylcobalamin-dependent ribonucleoside-diphosphate reductase [Armatimonadetes bacterium]|jgi:ribonucleoside-diphosphate reductase alpha chain|nr:adenosylcobalamin-dependent ribonucleoside-diphosphate reductase [Armatimonadota bacterium]